MSDTPPSKTHKESITHELKGIVYKGPDEIHSKSKLQSGQHVIEWMLSLCSEKPGKKIISYTDASNQVAKEIINDWISKNVCPQNVLKRTSLKNKGRLCLF